MYPASSDARNVTADAISSAVPKRPSGVWPLIWSVSPRSAGGEACYAQGAGVTPSMP
jgi:hypothetical protein